MSAPTFFNLEVPAAGSMDSIKSLLNSFLSDRQCRADMIPHSLLRGEFVDHSEAVEKP